MKKRTLLTMTLCLSLGTNVFTSIAQERNPFGSPIKSADPFEGVIENTQKKRIEELRKRPRFGMTEEEITLLWGKSLEIDAVYSRMAKGVKKEHEKYINKNAPATLYKVGGIKITVFYHHGKASCFRVGSNKDLTVEGMRQIAEEMCRVRFAKFPNNVNQDFAVYSTDRGQSFMFQYARSANRVNILYMPSWTQYWTEREAKVSDKIAEDALNQDIIKKKTEALRARPRLGMTEEELTLLWGKPARNGKPTFYGWAGVKKQHEQYLPVTLEGKTFLVGDIILDTGFISGKAVAITIGSSGEKFTHEEYEKIARMITRTDFPSGIRSKDGFAVYSTDRGQRYLFNRGTSRYSQVIDIEAIISMQSAKAKTILDKTLQSL